MQAVIPPDAPPFGAMLARAYQSHWRDHSVRLLAAFPRFAGRFDIEGARLIDVACGEGTFAVGMARRGWDVMGVDLSADMLNLAQARAKREGAKVEFLRQDMRRLDLPEPAHVATCWFNSLNYLLTEDNLYRALVRIRASLAPGGWFLFDVYTPHGLSVDWATRAWIAVDEPDCFVVADTRWFPDEMLAAVHFTGFIEEGGRFHRFDEHHRNRGYSWERLRELLGDAGFSRAEAFTLPAMRNPDRKTVRLFAAAQAEA